MEKLLVTTIFSISHNVFRKILSKSRKKVVLCGEKLKRKSMYIYRSFNGYNDELMLGAAILYEATGDIVYRIQAENLFPASEKSAWALSWDDKNVLAHVCKCESLLILLLISVFKSFKLQTEIGRNISLFVVTFLMSFIYPPFCESMAILVENFYDLPSTYLRQNIGGY